MSQPTQKDQVVIALDRLLEQFKGKPNIEGMLTSYIQQVQDLEETNFSLLNDRSINTAIGNQLDVLGALVNEARLGRDDETYRIAILTRIGINNSEGTPNQIMALLKSIEGSTKVNMWEHFPVSAIYYTNTEFTGRNCVSDTLQLISPATSADVVVIYDPYEEALTLSELSLQDFIIIDEFGNFLVTGEGGILVTNAGDTIIFNTGEEIKVTGGEVSFGDLITGQFYDDVDDGTLEFAVLSEILPDTLDVQGDPSPAPEEGLLISSDGALTEPLEVWYATEVETTDSPYGVPPEICVAGVSNIIPTLEEFELLTVDSDIITVDSTTITADQTVVI